MLDKVVESLVEFGENMVPINLGTLLRTINKYDREFNWIYSRFCNKSTELCMIGEVEDYEIGIYFIDYNKPNEVHESSVNDDVLITFVTVLKKPIVDFCNERYHKSEIRECKIIINKSIGDE